jgi:hypothetical protein
MARLPLHLIIHKWESGRDGTRTQPLGHYRSIAPRRRVEMIIAA